MKILLSSVGRRSYLVKYFKEILGEEGEVHVSNSSAYTPAFPAADKNVITPLIYDEGYIPFMLDYCSTNKIDAIIPLFDIDLGALSVDKDKFEQIGTKVIVSDTEVIDICNDKLETSRFLKSYGFNVARTFNSLESAQISLKRKEISYPLIIKPRWGMGSIGIYQADNDEELKVFYKKVLSEIKSTYLKYESQKNIENSILIQERLNGQEYGLDIINDLSANYFNTVVKKKFAMRSGETDCSMTVNNPILKELGEQISLLLKHIGNLDVDVFLDGDTPYILEINARFGGGYPFSHAAGVNLPLAIIKWLENQEVDKSTLTEKENVLSHKDLVITQLPTM
ncbi:MULTISPECIES: ATP-grasp domain-containing protein [Allobacillus]|uniref:ATP-grasp domain-containing protein n=1 Tax=Allobacillus salarius TaxID=1955272 RepID=A0A556PMR1_9BACI|nr:ATP-grasp domain-containing protein [Allobacillus salarius]TSJ65639.1 ATP-grasp domain-containing protein [Allobacillus salarius]